MVKTVSGQLFDQSGSGFEPPLDHTLVDDENLNLDLPGIIRLDFQCTYPYEHKVDPSVVHQCLHVQFLIRRHAGCGGRSNEPSPTPAYIVTTNTSVPLVSATVLNIAVSPHPILLEPLFI